ncbi:unnamed protein product [Mesocestoides corti]|uniref:Uncharacterized protein n=1 Tax=Mesocestoides corti TaxID=53468 RepID=A0A0R3UGD7_MESCO|nr:unnamed protein product [Mesocestoides corti]
MPNDAKPYFIKRQLKYPRQPQERTAPAPPTHLGYPVAPMLPNAFSPNQVPPSHLDAFYNPGSTKHPLPSAPPPYSEVEKQPM